MRVYDTPSHWHLEPDYPPEVEDYYYEKYGENWEKIIFDIEQDHKHINLEGINL